MISNLEAFLTYEDFNLEEKEIIDLPLFCNLNLLKKNKSLIFYDKLIYELNSLKRENFGSFYKYLFLLHYLYKNLLEVSFLNEKFLNNFVYKCIFPFYDFNYKENIIINDNIIKLCQNKSEPIITHLLNIIVNKYLFEDNLNDLYYLLQYFDNNFLVIYKFQK